MVIRRVGRVGAERNPRRRNLGAVYCDGGNVVCGGAFVMVVVASRVVHYWNCGDGRYCASSTEFVSLPGDLDITALDPCYRISVPDTVGRIDSNERPDPPISTPAKCSTVGGRAFPDGVIADLFTNFRSRSESRDRDILR